MSGSILKIPTLKGMVLEFGKMFWRPVIWSNSSGSVQILDLTTKEYENASVVIVQQATDDDDAVVVLPLPNEPGRMFAIFAPTASGGRVVSLRQGNATDGIGDGGTNNTNNSQVRRPMTLLISLDGKWQSLISAGGFLANG